MCDAMVPALAASLLSTPVEAAGAISSFALAYGLLQLVYGPLGDRFGKPTVISFAAWGCAAGSLAAALAPSLELLLVARMAMGGCAAAIIPLTMAWIGDHVPMERRQESLAGLLTWTVLGMMSGAVAGGALAQTVGWRFAFGATSVVFLVAAIGVGRAGGGDAHRGEWKGTGAFLARVAELLRSSWTRHLLAVVFLEGGLVYGSIAFIPAMLHERFDLSLVAAGGVVAMFGLGGLFYSRLAKAFVTHLGAPRLAGTGAVLLATAFSMLAAMSHWWVAALACFVAGLGFYMLHNTLQTCATQLSTAARGTGVSLFVTSLFLGQACGIAIAAFVAQRFTATAWFMAGVPVLLILGASFSSRLRARSA